MLKQFGKEKDPSSTMLYFDLESVKQVTKALTSTFTPITRFSEPLCVSIICPNQQHNQ